MPCTTSATVSKSSSLASSNLFMSKWVRDSERFSVDSERSRQPECWLTTNLCSRSQYRHHAQCLSSLQSDLVCLQSSLRCST